VGIITRITHFKRGQFVAHPIYAPVCECGPIYLAYLLFMHDNEVAKNECQFVIRT